VEEHVAESPLAAEAARILLSDAFGIAPECGVHRCRVNFFEAGYLSLPPGALALVRQDMLGRRHTHLFSVESLREVAVEDARPKQRRLRFRADEVVWQIDRVADEPWEELRLHVGRVEPTAHPAEAASTTEAASRTSTVAPAEPPVSAAPVDPAAYLPSGGAPDPTAAAAAAATAAAAPPAPPAPPEVAASPEAAAPPTSPAAAPPEAAAPPTSPATAPPGAPSAPVAVEGYVPSGGQPAAPARGAPPRTPVDELLDFLDDAVRRDPTPEDLAPLLRKLFHQSQALEQGDRALMAAQALLSIGRAAPPERQHAERYRATRVLEPSGPLAPEHWDALRDLSEPDRALMGVLDALRPALVRITGLTPRDVGLKGQPEDASKLVFGRVFATVRDALGLPRVRFHPQPEGPRGIRFANLVQHQQWLPTLVVGADYLTGQTELSLAFRVAQELTFLRPEHLLRVLTPALAQQAVLVLTAVAMADPDQPIAGEQEQAIKNQLSHLSKYMELEDFEQVGQAVRRLLGQTEPFDLGRWNQAVERAALRVGLLLCGDVQVAARSLDDPGSAAERRAVHAELIRFAVGRRHRRLRRELDLAIVE
jgi:hypothetical protein